MRSMTPAVIAAALTLAACTSGGSADPTTGPAARPSGAASPAPGAAPASGHHLAAVWPTYHHGNDRAGFADIAGLHAPLHRAWTRRLGGAVYAQPIVVGGLVIAATENDTVYALRARSGGVVWRSHLGTPVPRSELPCGNIDPLGITGTPAYDVSTGSVFVVTETTGAHHVLHALDVVTGRSRWTRGLDVVAGRDRAAEQQRSALLVAHGRVYAAFGGLFGDCGNYVGYLTGVATNGTGRTLSYAVPTARAGGIWAPPGPVTSPYGGDLYVAIGNGAETGGHYDGSDSVIRLTPGLQRVALFAPSTWSADNAQDLDLGSSSPVPIRGRIVIAGKRGTVYLLRSDLGGIGGQVATLSGCPAYGGAATAGQLVFLPCNDGIRRLEVTADSMRWDWTVAGVSGSPVLTRDVLYALDTDRGDLVVVSARTGQVRTRIHVGAVTRFATPVPVGRLVYVGTTGGVVAVAGAS